MFGGVQNIQDENTKFDPKSPYAASKVFAHSITKIYRDAYGIFAANGILFNHESPLRGETFVTKKIVKALTKIKFEKQKCLYLGNLYAKRDWGHAKDYVIAMWKILQVKKADDFVIATNKQFSIKEFINLVAQELKLKLNWRGKGLNEIGYTSKGKVVIRISKRYFRPLDVNNLKGNYSKAKKILKWKPKTTLAQLIKEMVNFELKNND